MHFYVGYASGNDKKMHPEAFWGPFRCLAPEMLKMGIPGLLGAICLAGSGNAQNEHLEASWEPFRRLAREMIKMSILRLHGSHLAVWLRKYSK